MCGQRLPRSRGGLDGSAELDGDAETRTVSIGRFGLCGDNVHSETLNAGLMAHVRRFANPGHAQGHLSVGGMGCRAGRQEALVDPLSRLHDGD